MYSTEASNWFNQSALAAKDGSARPQRTTHERRPDHHDDGGDCGDGGDFDDHDCEDDEDEDDDDEKRVVVPVLMCGGNKKSPSHPTLVCQMLLTITRIMMRIIIMIRIMIMMIRIIVAARHHQGYDHDS